MSKKIDEVTPAPAWAIGIDSKGKIEKMSNAMQAMQDAVDAERWRKLIRLIDRETIIRLYISDLFERPTITVQHEKYQGNPRGSFNDVIDSIPEPQS